MGIAYARRGLGASGCDLGCRAVRRPRAAAADAIERIDLPAARPSVSFWTRRRTFSTHRFPTRMTWKGSASAWYGRRWATARRGRDSAGPHLDAGDPLFLVHQPQVSGRIAQHPERAVPEAPPPAYESY